ncbi:MAG: hypothetical protein NT025_04675 [bacterium]|nr:hypothetical protein [bacterium]
MTGPWYSDTTIIGAFISGFFALIAALIAILVKRHPRKKIVVETLALQIDQKAREFVDLPPHALVVRARNQGKASVRLVEYGVRAEQHGQRTATLPSLPFGHREAPGRFQPGSYHEFTVDLDEVSAKLKNVVGYAGEATLRGFYQDSEGRYYESRPARFNLETLDIHW